MDLKAAKEALERRVAGEPWVRGIGVGLVDARPGLVLSVALGSEQDAERCVRESGLDVPVRVRGIGEVAKRRAGG